MLRFSRVLNFRTDNKNRTTTGIWPHDNAPFKNLDRLCIMVASEWRLDSFRISSIYVVYLLNKWHIFMHFSWRYCSNTRTARAHTATRTARAHTATRKPAHTPCLLWNLRYIRHRRRSSTSFHHLCLSLSLAFCKQYWNISSCPWPCVLAMDIFHALLNIRNLSLHCVVWPNMALLAFTVLSDRLLTGLVMCMCDLWTYGVFFMFTFIVIPVFLISVTLCVV